MADGLDVVAVRVEDEGAVVVRVVDLADTRSAVVGPAGGERGGVEGVNQVASIHAERHVDARLRAAVSLRDPEEGKVVPKPADLGDRLHDHAQPERLERALVEGPAGLVVGDVQSDVVESHAHDPSYHGADLRKPGVSCRAITRFVAGRRTA